MDIPTNADVMCDNDLCGRSTHVILNPVSKEVTHVVVKQKDYPYTERLVPLDWVVESTPHQIRLRCTKEELNHMERFVETEFLEAAGAAGMGGPYMMWPYSYPEYGFITLEHQHVPVGELAVRRGARVDATDGHVGRVDEFLVDPTSEHITHLVMREGHLWGQKDVTLPVEQIDRIEEDTVYLKLDKKSYRSAASHSNTPGMTQRDRGNRRGTVACPPPVLPTREGKWLVRSRLMARGGDDA